MNEKKLSGSFAWLNITQFLGALNDNVFKLLVIFLLVALIGEQHRTQIVSTASIVFVIPFLLFSHAGGTLADRISKRNIIVCLKILEIVITVLGCIAIYNKSSWGLYAIIFLLCTHSAFFSPSKYGIVPELVTVLLPLLTSPVIRSELSTTATRLYVPAAPQHKSLSVSGTTLSPGTIASKFRGPSLNICTLSK